NQLERRLADWRQDRLAPCGGREDAPVVAWCGDELKAEWEAIRAKATRDRDRRSADQRPARTESWITGGLERWRFAHGRWREDRVVRRRPLREVRDEAAAPLERCTVRVL